jgi:hypothetical protein
MRATQINLAKLYRKEIFDLVSIDYRLGLELKLPEIIKDLKVTCRWVRTEGVHELITVGSGVHGLGCGNR